MAHRLAVIAALLSQRIAEAEEADPDPGYAMITGFARTTAEVSAAMNMSAMGANHVVAQAAAVDARLPAVGALLAEGRTDWRTVQVIIAPSAALERWIQCRDLTCRFPGCDRPATHCGIDHTIPFNHADPAAGGLTVAVRSGVLLPRAASPKQLLPGRGRTTEQVVTHR